MATNKGIVLALSTALISGFAVFLNKFAVSFWKNSSVFTTGKNLLVALFLTSLLFVLKKIPEFKKVKIGEWLKLIVIGFVGGSIPFLLFFKALSMISSSNAAFIHKTLFIWVALIAIPFLKEKISKIQLLGLAILGISVFLIGPPANFKIGQGEFLAFLATLLWAIENVLAKSLLKNLSSFLVAWARMSFGSVFLIIYLIFNNSLHFLLPSSFNHLFWLLISSLILFGYVSTWYSALKYIPVTIASSILVIATPITIILNRIFLAKTLPANFLFLISLFSLGILFILQLYSKIIELFRVFKTKQQEIPQ